MAKLLKLRRGTTSQHSSFTGAEGEVTVDTDKESLVVHNGSTAGGFPLLRQDLSNLPTGTIDNADVSSSAAIAGSKISPTFTSNVTISNTEPNLLLQDTNNNSDFKIQNANGVFKVLDSTSNNGRFTIASDGTATFTQNLNALAGLDVTGNITSTGNVDATGFLRAGGTYPRVYLTDSDNDSDWVIINNNGGFVIRDDTNGTSPLTISASGTTQVNGNLDVSSGIDVTGSITATGQFVQTTTADEKIILGGSNNPYIRFREGSTDKAYVQWNTGGFLLLANQETGDNLRIGNSSDGLTWTHDGTTSKIFHAGNDGDGSGLDADSLDSLHSTSFLRSDADDVCTHRIQFQNNATDNHDDMASGTGSLGGIEIYNSSGGNDAFMAFHTGGDFALYFGLNADSNKLAVGGWSMGANKYDIAHEGSSFIPADNNTYDLGSASYRWRNVYTNDLHLSNEGHSNDVDGTWGNWTIQEGESDLFLKNNRSGKKYKFNLTEVS